jgi:stage II sporulation protein GA (sporulation sigma-E factor processing peptidase)
MVINIDVLIIENIMVNYFLLYITSQTIRIKTNFKRVILPSTLGGLYVVTMVFPKLKLLTTLPFKLLIAVIMIIIMLRVKDLILNIKALLIYILYSMMMAGICFFIEISGNSNAVYNRILLNFSYKELMLVVILLYVLINRMVIYIRDRKQLLSLTYIVEIVDKESQKLVTALLDTGNELREPATNLPVMILERSYIEHFQIGNDERLYIPYKVVNGQGGMLLGFKPDYIIIHNGSEMKRRDVVVAFCDGKLSDLNDYNALLSRGII